jgi:hypothetical protein
MLTTLNQLQAHACLLLSQAIMYTAAMFKLTQ